MTSQYRVTISAQHPSLAGHFPNMPVIPGVVILDHVRQCMEATHTQLLSSLHLKQVKFVAPVQIGDDKELFLDIEIEDRDHKLYFRCYQKGNLVADGMWIERP